MVPPVRPLLQVYELSHVVSMGFGASGAWWRLGGMVRPKPDGGIPGEARKVNGGEAPTRRG